MLHASCACINMMIKGDMVMFTKEQRYGCDHEFNCMVCGQPIVEQYYPNDCICCDCVDKGFDHTFVGGEPVVIASKEVQARYDEYGNDRALMAQYGQVDFEGEDDCRPVYAVKKTVYCEHCGIVAVADGDKYCLVCAQEITDFLAARFDEQAETFSEQIAVDGGLY